MCLSHSVIPVAAGSAGTKDEDEQLTQLLKEEEAQILQKILTLRRDVRAQSGIDGAVCMQDLHRILNKCICFHSS